MKFTLCPWATFGLVKDILFLTAGIIAVWKITQWASVKKWVGELYCIALIAAIVVAIYACMNYDVKKLKCGCKKTAESVSNR